MISWRLLLIDFEPGPEGGRQFPSPLEGSLYPSHSKRRLLNNKPQPWRRLGNVCIQLSSPLEGNLGAPPTPKGDCQKIKYSTGGD